MKEHIAFDLHTTKHYCNYNASPIYGQRTHYCESHSCDYRTEVRKERRKISLEELSVGRRHALRADS